MKRFVKTFAIILSALLLFSVVGCKEKPSDEGGGLTTPEIPAISDTGIVLAENGAANAVWDTTNDGAGLTISLDGLHVVTTKMEAGYLVRTLFDNNVWTVTPGLLPKLK